MVNNFNGPLRTVQDLALEIARGRVPGAVSFGGFGEYTPASTPVTNHIIWPNGPFIYPTFGGPGLSFEVVSSSINDTLAGTGVQKAELHILDAQLEPRSVIINMNGTTPVTVDEDGAPLPPAAFFQCTHVEKTGTFGQGAVGTITVRPAGGGATYALIAPGDTRCASSARMVPKGKRAIVYGLVGSSISGTAAAQAKLQVVATELDNHQYTDQGIFIPFGSIGVQDASQAFVLPTPSIFREGTVIAMRGSVDKGATLTGDWFGWLEDAE